MREFAAGFGTLFRGFGHWRRSPGVMVAGLLPAAIVAVVALAALIAWAFAVPGVAAFLTPFADSWDPTWTGLLRTALSIALFGGAVFLVAITFTALTLVVGEPFYDRVWRSVEKASTGEVPDAPYGFWRAVGDSIRLVGRGVGVAAGAGAIGLVPVVGGIAGTAVGVASTGWLLADELSSRALSARGFGEDDRRMLRRRSRARTLGFGVATQLCFLVPLGAIAVMPAAVAGATLLAHDLLVRDGRALSASAPPPATPPARG
jgi:CysZ protein